MNRITSYNVCYTKLLRWGAKRAANGHPEPYAVKYWNIGNEPWLERDRPATSSMASIVAGYVRPIASAMKAVDPAIRIYAPDECYYMQRNNFV